MMTSVMLSLGLGLAVQHGYPTRLEFVDPSGTPLGRWQVQSNAWLTRIEELPTGWYATYREMTASDESNEFQAVFHAGIHDEDGRRVHTYHREVRESRFDGTRRDAEDYHPWVHESDGRLRERVEIVDPSGSFDHDYDALALLDDGRAMVLRNLRPALRAATAARMHPDVLAKLPPVPDDREDIAFTPILCDLVPAD